MRHSLFYRVSLSCASVCLSSSVIHPSASIKTIRHVPKASCHSDCPSEGTRSWCQCSVQRGRDGASSSVIYSPALIETAVRTFLSISVSSPPSSVSPFPSAFVGELMGGACWSEKFHLTCLLLRLEDNRPFTSALTAHCGPAGRKLQRIQCSCSNTQSVDSFCF